MRRTLAPLAAGLVLVGITACSPDSGDFSSEAEDFIEDDDEELASTVGMTFDDAECDEPADTEVDTEFACTATGSDGVVYQFAAIIDGDRSFTVGVVGPATDAAPAGTAGEATVAATATTAADG